MESNDKPQPSENKQDFPPVPANQPPELKSEPPQQGPVPVRQPHSQAPVPPQIQIMCVLETATGQLGVHFPIEHKDICIQVLTDAIKAVYFAQPKAPFIQPSTQLPPGIKMLFKSNGKGGH